MPDLEGGCVAVGQRHLRKWLFFKVNSSALERGALQSQLERPQPPLEGQMFVHAGSKSKWDMWGALAQIRQSRSDSGLAFQVKVLKTVKVFPLRSRAVGG